MKTNNLSTLKIHKFKNEQQYETAKANGYVDDNDLILIPDDGAATAADAVLYTEQTLTEEQKAQARYNIGAERAIQTISIDAPTSLAIEDGKEYYLTNVSNLTITYPDGSFECYIHLSTLDGEVTVVLPESGYIGFPPEFGAGETWELSIKNGVIVAGVVS